MLCFPSVEMNMQRIILIAWNFCIVKIELNIIVSENYRPCFQCTISSLLCYTGSLQTSHSQTMEAGFESLSGHVCVAVFVLPSVVTGESYLNQNSPDGPVSDSR